MFIKFADFYAHGFPMVSHRFPMVPISGKSVWNWADVQLPRDQNVAATFRNRTSKLYLIRPWWWIPEPQKHGIFPMKSMTNAGFSYGEMVHDLTSKDLDLIKSDLCLPQLTQITCFTCGFLGNITNQLAGPQLVSAMVRRRESKHLVGTTKCGELPSNMKKRRWSTWWWTTHLVSRL